MNIPVNTIGTFDRYIHFIYNNQTVERFDMTIIKELIAVEILPISVKVRVWVPAW